MNMILNDRIWYKKKVKATPLLKKITWLLILLIIVIIFTSCPGIVSEPEAYTVTYDGNWNSG